MASTKGALYLESCHDSEYCYLQLPSYLEDFYTEEKWDELVYDFKTNSTFVEPWNKIQVSYNKFINN